MLTWSTLLGTLLSSSAPEALVVDLQASLDAIRVHWIPAKSISERAATVRIDVEDLLALTGQSSLGGRLRSGRLSCQGLISSRATIFP